MHIPSWCSRATLFSLYPVQRNPQNSSKLYGINLPYVPFRPQTAAKLMPFWCKVSLVHKVRGGAVLHYSRQRAASLETQHCSTWKFFLKDSLRFKDDFCSFLYFNVKQEGRRVIFWGAIWLLKKIKGDNCFFKNFYLRFVSIKRTQKWTEINIL